MQDFVDKECTIYARLKYFSWLDREREREGQRERERERDKEREKDKDKRL